MAAPSKSQWDFGELFPVEAMRKVLTVGEFTASVKRLLEKQVGQVWVSGEITNFRAQESGHLYFTLKDANSQVSCVIFRSDVVAGKALLQDGRAVILQGTLTVYEARGAYQLRITKVELQGVGALQTAFDKLKAQLLAEGLFDVARKRILPRFPRRIGIVSSRTGAAIRDVLHVIGRRHPSLEIIVAHCRVQGLGAGKEIACAIKLLNRFNESATPEERVDLILLTRGGGSLEDLWAFNEEVVARAIHQSALAIVSAVGHEIDFTISDFVADLRAATPSAAAELITEGIFASRRAVTDLDSRLRRRLFEKLESMRDSADALAHRHKLSHPRDAINEYLQRLDDLNFGLRQNIGRAFAQQQSRWNTLYERMLRLAPATIVDLKKRHSMLRAKRLSELIRQQFTLKAHRYASVRSKLSLLGPEQVFARGYSITMDTNTGGIIKDAAELRMGQSLTTRLQHGEVLSAVSKLGAKK